MARASARGGKTAPASEHDGGARRQDVPCHTDWDQAALASDTDDGGDGSSDESFDYDYSDGDPTSDAEASFCIAQRRRTEFLCSEKEGTARGTRGRFFQCVGSQ